MMSIMRNSQEMLRKTDILRSPLKPLNPGARWGLKALLLGLGHLITIENSHSLHSVEDPVIIALNHNCSFETILVPAFLIYYRRGRIFSTVSDWMYGRIPVVSWLFNQVDPVYVFNKPSTIQFLNQTRKAVRPTSIIPECLHRLTLGKSILIFPEGTRNRDPHALKKGKTGIGHLALMSKRPVLPIGIDFPLRQKKGRIPKFGSIVLRIGEPMTFPEEILKYEQSSSCIETTGPRQKIAHQLASVVTYEIMKEISRLSGKSYPFPKPCLSFERTVF